MKIGLFTHVKFPYTSGVATAVENLANKLKEYGHEVYIISNNYDGIRNDFGNKDDLKVKSIPLFYQNLRTPILINFKLFNILDEINLDIIHSHSDFGMGIIARAYALKNNIPLIHTYHCDYLGYAEKNFGNMVESIVYNPIKLYTKSLCLTSNRLIVPSNETKKILVNDFNIKRSIDVVPNGIDFKKFSSNNEVIISNLRKKYNISKDDFVIVSISRLSKEKGIDEIINIMPLLKNNNIKLLIVGSGPIEMSLKYLKDKLGLENVMFTGEIPFDEVHNYYKLGDVFVSSSKAETQGLSVIEALSSSLPCLCINNPVFSEIIRNKSNGFIYSSKEELLEFLKYLYLNKDILNKLKENTAYSVKDFSLDNTTKKIENIYNEELVKKRVLNKD